MTTSKLRLRVSVRTQRSLTNLCSDRRLLRHFRPQDLLGIARLVAMAGAGEVSGLVRVARHTDVDRYSHIVGSRHPRWIQMHLSLGKKREGFALTVQTIRIDTGTDDLLAQREGRVLILSMNRPMARNALSLEMVTAMEEQLARGEADNEIACIVLTGTEGAFCAGGDVTAMAVAGEDETSPSWLQRQRRLQQATAGKLFTMPKPTIAAINGPAAGAGFSLAMACDLRTMSTDALLTTAFAKIGLSGDFGGTYFISQLIGTAKARELFYLSDRIMADEALQLGLVNRLYAPDVLLEETLALAARLASGPSIAVGFMKENLNRALLSSVADCLDTEAALHIACLTTGDHREAAAAFVEKRPPVFKGC